MQPYEISRRDSAPIMREYNAMMKHIDRGDPFHPQEVQDMIDALVEEGCDFQAQTLARAKINWDR